MDAVLFAIFNAFSYLNFFICGNVLLHTEKNTFFNIVGDFWISRDIFIAHLYHTGASRGYLYGWSTYVFVLLFSCRLTIFPCAFSQ